MLSTPHIIQPSPSIYLTPLPFPGIVVVSMRERGVEGSCSVFFFFLFPGKSTRDSSSPFRKVTPPSTCYSFSFDSIALSGVIFVSVVRWHTYWLP